MLFTGSKILRHWEFLVLLQCFSVIFADGPQESYFPSDVKICSAKDPNINECFTNSANKMLQHLVPGIRRLNAIPLNPLKVPLMTLSRGNNLLPNLAFNLTNTEHSGWTKAVVLRSMINPRAREFKIIFQFPQLHVRGLYDVTGSIAGIPLEGSGDMEFYLTNPTFDLMVHGRLVEKRGQEFMVIDNWRQNSTIEKLKVDIRNLFNNTELSRTTNNLLNQNNRAVLDEAGPVIEQVFGELHVQIMQRILDSVPYRMLFTDLDDEV